MDGLTDEQRIEAWKSCWEKSLVGMAIVEENGAFRSVNDQWMKMLGVPASEFYGNSWQDITPQDEIYQDAAQASLVAKGMIDSYELDKSYKFKNGTTKTVRLLVTRIPMDTAKPFQFFLSRIVLRHSVNPDDSKSNMCDPPGSARLPANFYTQVLDFLVGYWKWLAVASAALFGIANELFHWGF